MVRTIFLALLLFFPGTSMAGAEFLRKDCRGSRIVHHPKISVSIRENNTLSYCAYTATVSPKFSSSEYTPLDDFLFLWDEVTQLSMNQRIEYIESKVVPALKSVLFSNLEEEVFLSYGGGQLMDTLGRDSEILSACLLNLTSEKPYSYEDGLIVECGYGDQSSRYVKVSVESVSSAVFFQ